MTKTNTTPDRQEYVGRKNRYCCEKCQKNIITVDRDAGVTPFMLQCKRTPGCDGWMTSRFYIVEDVWPEPQYEWRKPTSREYKRMPDGMKQHVDQGGLALYPIETISPTSS